MNHFPGARWWKIDFHTHTKASADFMNGRPRAEKEAFSHCEWLRACLEAGLDCVVVTDHNGGGSIDELKAEFRRMQDSGDAGDRSLVIFPGVELSSACGVHILGILDPSLGTQEIGALIGACGYRGVSGASDECSVKTPVEIVKEIEARNGVAVMAHADGPKGIFRLASTQDGTPLLRHDSMLPFEQIDFSAELPDWIRNTKPQLTRVAGSDCHFKHGQDIPGSRFTWIKMGCPSIEGLRMALLDGDEVSVWHSGDPKVPFHPNRTPDSYIEEINIQGTRLMGLKSPEIIKFNPWMNSVIGGRGTGKSSIVHFLRRILDQDDELGPSSKENGNLLRKVFDEFMREPRKRDDKGILRPDSRLCLTLRHEGHRFRITWKVDGTRLVETEDGLGDWRPSESQEVRRRFKAQVYSQGQVADLAERGASLLDHVDRIAGTESFLAALNDAQDAVKVLLTRKRTMERKASEREKLRAQYEDTKLKLAQFETHHHSEILRAFQRRQRQGTEIQKQLQEARHHVEELDCLAALLVQADLPDGLFDAALPEDREIITFQASIRDAIHDAKDMVVAAKLKLEAAASQFEEGTQKGQWAAAREAIKAKYSDLTLGLKLKGILDPSDYGRLVQDRQRIEEEFKGFDSLQEKLNRLEADLDLAVENLSKARWAISRHRSEFIAEALSGNPFIQIEVEPLGRDHDQLETALRTILAMPGDAHAQQIFQEVDGKYAGEVHELLRDLPADQTQAGAMVERRIQALKEKVVAAVSGQARPFGGRLDTEIRKLRLGEDSILELKEVRFAGEGVVGPHRDSLADELAAFANGRGGVCVLGVDDSSKEILGIPVDRLDKVETFVRTLIQDSIKPPPIVYLERMSLPDLTGVERAILKIEVPKSLFVHQSPGGYLHRVGSSKRGMAPDYLARLFQQRSQARLIRFDEQAVPQASLGDLVPELYNRFRTQRTRDEDSDLLGKLAMARQDDDLIWHPTVSGILMATRDPRVWIPNAFVQAVAYAGTDPVPASGMTAYQLDAKDITGPLDGQVIEACRFVQRNMRMGAIKDVGREDVPQFDMTAVFEALVNAVAHRDYSIYGAKIRLRMFTDRLEIYTPGQLSNTMSVASLAFRQAARNEALTSLLAKCEVPDGLDWLRTGRRTMMDKRGEGVQIILDRSEGLSGKLPEYCVLDDSELLLTIYGSR